MTRQDLLHLRLRRHSREPGNGGGLWRRYADVPTEKERQGDFSDLLKLGPQYQIYDPATRVAIGNGRYQSQPFPGNIIPSNRINPVAQNILSFYSLPNVPGTADATNNLIRVNDAEVIDYDNHVARVDHNFGTNNRMYGRFNMYKRFSHSSDWFRSPATGGYSDWGQHAFSVDDVHNFSANTFLNVRYSFFRLFDLPVPEAGKPWLRPDYTRVPGELRERDRPRRTSVPRDQYRRLHQHAEQLVAISNAQP